ncbi:hypothetical protein CPB86DRAFT_822673 [Serendipita vermifera]|nr:hypothetical protein CPB86DRAFT_822673 [Serendipita vermifera]
MATSHPNPVFVKGLKITRAQTDTKDILLMDDETPVWGIGMDDEPVAESSIGQSLKGLLPRAMALDRDIGRVCRYDQSHGKVMIGEIKWVGDRKDKWRWNGGNWKKLKEVWIRYSLVKHRVKFCDRFVGSNDKDYIWFQQGAQMVLHRGSSKGDPVVATYVDEGTDKEFLWLTKEAYEVGDLLFITLLTSEGMGARRRFQSGPKKYISTIVEPAYHGWVA